MYLPLICTFLFDLYDSSDVIHEILTLSPDIGQKIKSLSRQSILAMQLVPYMC